MAKYFGSNLGAYNMNHIFRVVWSKTQLSWVAVGELAKSHGSSGASSRILRRACSAPMIGFGKYRLFPNFVLALGALIANSVLAASPAPNQLPVGGQVAAGQAAISQSGANMQINQGSQQAIINWQGFNIGSSAAVNVNQPNRQATLLNRVNSVDHTQIDGRLTANGQVFILNSKGVVFGPGAKVDVGGLVAGAMKITDADFLAGNYKFTQGEGVVTNMGELSAKEAGFIALLAPEVRNEGIIRAKLGAVVLAAGEEVTLTNSASGLTVVINKGSLNALIENRQLISTEDGNVFMSARAANSLQRAVINNTGTIEAKSAKMVGGVIRLSADVINNEGTLDTSTIPSTANVGAKGGEIAIQATFFTNTGNVRANGDQGGKIQIDTTEALRNDGVIEVRGDAGQILLSSLGKFIQSQLANIFAGNQTTSGTAGLVQIQAQNVEISGTIDASSVTQGGSIDIAGESAVISNALLNSSGDTSGGRIAIRAQPVAPAPTAPTSPSSPGAPGNLTITGSSISTSSRRGRAGDVILTGDDINLSNTKVDATGVAGGGKILIGGDWQGSGELPHAITVTIASDVILDASATDNGDGGTIVAWSDVNGINSLTTVSGTLLARGGANGGNGGKIETSGHILDVTDIQVNAESQRGNGGEWLIDPYDITIASSGASGTPYNNTYTATQNSTILASNIATALSAGTSVTINTGVIGSAGSYAGNIKVIGAITKTGASLASLRLNAANKIDISAAIGSTGTGALNLILNAGGGVGLISGVLSGNLGLTKEGAGSLRILSSNTYTGDTYLGGGELGLYTNTAISNSALTMAGGTALLLGRGVTSLTNNITLNGAASIGLDSYVDYLIVGGGGGGGSRIAGGGGGGQVMTGTVDASGSLAITVGAGGIRNGTTTTPGDGGDSSVQFSTLITANGGLGSINNAGTGGKSGSGYAGGSAWNNGNDYFAGGGGGAGAVGTNGKWAIGGTGGSGTASNITGQYIYYGGGGGGGATAWTGGGGPGVDGGGSGGGGYSAAVAGTNGLGGGGGGGGVGFNNANTLNGAAGGSGVVVIRYMGAQAGSGGTPTVGSGAATGYTLHTFTTVGSDTLTLNAINPILSGAITGSGGLTLNAIGGKITITGNNTYSGGSTIQGGDVQLGKASTGGSLGTGAIVNNSRLLLDRTDDFILANTISGTGSLNKSQSNTITFTGNNSYAGYTNIVAGTIQIGDGGISGNLGGGNIYNSGALIFNRSDDLTISSAISRAGALTKVGNNTLTLTGTNTYTGATNILGGTLVVQTNSPTTTSSGFNGPGALRIESVSASFTSGFTTGSSWNFNSNLGGLTIGRNGNTAAATIASGYGINIAGPISIYGGSITLAANLTSAATAGNGISLTGSKLVQNQGIAVSTQGADISYVIANSGFTSGNDYAMDIGVTGGARASINANGGQVNLSAAFGTTGTAGGLDRAMRLRDTDISSSGVGTIAITGNATNDTNTGDAWGIEWSNSKAQSVSGAVTITGIGGKASTNARGISAEGQGLAILSGSGAITLVDQKPTGLTGTYNGLVLQPTASGNLFIGADGSSMPTSSSAITIQADKVTFTANGTYKDTLNTSGAVVIESVGTAFASTLDTTNLTIAGTPSSVRLGKASNTADIFLGSALSATGPISIYGGNITANVNLTTSLLNSEILLKASGNITTAANRTLQTNGGNLALWSDSDSLNGGSILVGDANTFNTVNGSTIAITGGGRITLAGGAAIDASGLPTGPASSITSGVQGIAIGGAGVSTFYSANGDILIKGEYGSASGASPAGVDLKNINILSSSGAIRIDGGRGGIQVSGASILGGNTSGSASTSSSNVTLVGDYLGKSTMNLDSNANYLNAYTLSSPLQINTAGDIYVSQVSGFAGGSPVAFNSKFRVSNDARSLTISGGIGALEITGAQNLTAGRVTVNDENLTVSAAIQADTVVMNAATAISSAKYNNVGKIVANRLLAKGYGTVNFANSTNNVGTLAAFNVGAFNFTNAGALTIGSVDSVNGISATGSVSVSTKVGDLALEQNVSTTSASSTALVLNAGMDAAVGTTAGGNIIFSGNPNVTVGLGGIGKLLTGSLTGTTWSSALTDLVSGSGHFRYNADETTNFSLAGWTALGAGINAIYREKPSVTVSVANKSMIYGDSLPTLTGSLSGIVNGDNAHYTVLGQLNSSSGNIKVGDYTLSENALAGLGYNVTINTGSLSVAKKDLVITGLLVNDKTYDRLTSATIASYGALSGGVSGDEIGVVNSGANASFGDYNAGANKVVTVSGLSLTGADAGNYNLANQTTTATINRAQLTISGITADNKIYDATQTATVDSSLLQLVGKVSGDNEIAVSGVTGAFDTKNVGVDKSVNLSYTKSNSAAWSNYVVTDQISTKASITPATLTLSGASRVSKTYDGTTGTTGLILDGTTTAASAIGNLGGVLNGDTVSVSGSATFASANVTRDVSNNVTTQAITQGSIALAGADAGNYILSWANGSGKITPATLTVYANNDAKFVTQLDPNFTASYSGFVNGENVTTAGLAGTLVINRSDPTNNLAGNYVLQASGLSAGNYNITYANGAFTIVGSNQLLVRTQNASTTYGASANYTISSASYWDPLANSGTGSEVGLTGITYNGNNNVTIADGASASATFTLAPSNAQTSNSGKLKVGAYQLTTSGTVTENSPNFSNNIVVVGAHQVNQATLTPVVLGGKIKEYDGTAAMSNLSLTSSGIVTNDQVIISGVGAYSDKNVSRDSNSQLSANKTYDISNFALSGLDSSNYYISSSSISGSDGQITPKTLSVTYAGLDKVYDGLASATVTTSDNRLAGDSLDIVRTANFVNASGVADKNVLRDGSGAIIAKNIAVTGIGLSGADALNYVVSNTATASSAKITPASLIISGIVGVDKTYDKLLASTLNSLSLVKDGLVVGDDVALTATGAYADVNAGLGKTIAITSSYSGNDVNNYSIISQISTSASILKRQVSVSASGTVSKVYDGTTEMNGVSIGLGSVSGISESGVVAGDTVGVSGVGSFSSATVSRDANGNVLANKSYTLSDLQLSGDDAANYMIVGGVTTIAGTNGRIDPKILTLIGFDAASKVYDGTNTASIANAGTLNGLVGADVVTVNNGGASFSDKNAGIGKTVTLNGITLAGADSGNYSIASTSTDTANITAKALNISGLTASDKVYNGDTNAVVNGTAVFSSEAVGTGNVNDGKAYIGDTLNLTGTAVGVFNTKDVVSANEVTFSGLTLAGLDAINYTLIPHANNTTARITPKPITTASIAAVTTTYGTSASAGAVSLGGDIFAGDVVSAELANIVSPVYTGSNNLKAGSYSQSVGSTLSGSDSANYSFTGLTTGTANYIVNKLALTGSISTASSVYGDTLNVGTANFNNALANDNLGVATVAVSTAGNTSASGNLKAGTYTGIQSVTALSGADADNYTFSGVVGNYTVDAKPITTASIAAVTTTYGTSASAGAVSLGGDIFAGDVVSAELANIVSPVYTGSNNLKAGSYSQSVGSTLSGSDSANYSFTGLTTGTANYIVNKLALTGSISTASSVYGDTLNVGTANFNNALANDNLGVATVAVSTAGNTSASGNLKAGTYTGIQSVTALSGADADNYTFSGVVGNYTVDKAALDVVLNNDSKTYNGLAYSGGNGVAYSGFISGETESALGGSLIYGGSSQGAKNAGSYVIGASGLSADNYNINYINGALAVNKANAVVTANSGSVTYNGLSQSISGFSASGLVNNESEAVLTGVTAGGSGIDVGTYTTSAGGMDVNYNLSFLPGTLTIDKARLSAVGSKVYDGLISFAGSDLAVSGVNGQTFTATGSGTMASKNVQANQNLISIAGLAVTGIGLSNYEPLSLSDTAVSVTPRSVTLSAPNSTKVYDGTSLQPTTATDLSALSAQLVGGDSVSAAQIVYNNKDAGVGKRVTLNSVTISDDNNGANYNISKIDSNNGVITKAPLLVTAVNDAKFVTQPDTTGYNGAIYNGFVAGETPSVLTVGIVSRVNSGVNAAGYYEGVLQPSGWSAANYEITYKAGGYTIAGAKDLLVRSSPISATYGLTPTYNLAVQYLKDDGVTIITLNPSLTNNHVSVNDGVGSTAQFDLNAINPTFSSANQLRVGGYNLGYSNFVKTGNNFANLATVGAMTVTPKTLNNNLGVQSVSKVYDGNTSITGLDLSFNSVTAGVLENDVVFLSGSGSYDNRNVGSGKTVNLSLGLSGTDALNYALNTSNLSANVGTITQLSSVQYTGASGGIWSDSRNWAGGALPDANNVAQVIIPENKTVLYDADQVGVIGSQIANSGTVQFNSVNDFSFANTVSGSGSLMQRGTGMLTITGQNTFTGKVDIGNSAVTLASSGALGNGSIGSSGGRLTIVSGTTLPSLLVDGALTLTSDVATTGDQTYNGALTFLSSGTSSVPNFYSASGNISFMDTVSAGVGSKAAQRTLAVSALNGAVLFNNQVGQNVVDLNTSNYQTVNFWDYRSHASDINPYALDVDAKTIKLFADITTFESQRYKGAVLIGDNGANGKTRLLVSVDPSISLNEASVDDVSAGQHNLILRAISLPGTTAKPNISIGNVGQNAELASLDALVGAQWDTSTALLAQIDPNRATYVGAIDVAGSVKTLGDQNYLANTISLASPLILRSDTGTIEMTTGLTSGGSPQVINGLNSTTFSFGSGANGVGQNLAAQASSQNIALDIKVDPVPIPTPSFDRSLIANYRWAMAASALETSNFEKSTSPLDGQVTVEILASSECDPLKDENCQAN